MVRPMTMANTGTARRRHQSAPIPFLSLLQWPHLRLYDPHCLRAQRSRIRHGRYQSDTRIAQSQYAFGTRRDVAAEADHPQSGIRDTYPAGSLVVFSEGMRHTGTAGTQYEHPRKAVLIAYNHQTVRVHEPKPCMNPAIINALTQTQGFFKDVWVLGNKGD